MIQLFVTLVVYAVVIRTDTGLVPRVLLAVLIPTLINVAFRYIYISGGDFPLFQIFMLQDGIILALQLVLAYVIFRVLDQKEDSLVSWTVIAVVGFFVLYIVAPMAVLAMLSK